MQIAALYKVLTAKLIAEQSVEAAPVIAGSFANQTYKPDAALKRVGVAANVVLLEIEICKLHVAPVQRERIPQTLAALRANAGLFKTPISKHIAVQQAEVGAVIAVLSANQICRQCVALRPVVAQANVVL